MKQLVKLSILMAIFIQGCSVTPDNVNVPSNPTNVLNAEFSITGIIMPDATGEQRVLTRQDRRRVDSTTVFNSWVSRRILGSPDISRIRRPDLGVTWYMNNKRETYYECGLVSCKDFWSQFSTEGSEESDEEYYDPVDSGCQTDVSFYGFDVIELDKQREINGFIANRYEAKWKYELKDQEGRADTNELLMDFWMVEPTEAMREGWEINKAFHQNLAAKSREQNPLSKFVGGRVYNALAAFTGDIEKTESHALGANTAKLAAIPGYPVSIKLEWNQDRNTCPETKEKEPAADWSDPKQALGNIASRFAKKTVKNKLFPKPGEPILRYIYDVKSSEIKNIADTEFDVPNEYKLIDRD